MTERRASYDDSSIVCLCGDLAFRVPAYQEQYVFTESGGRSGKLGRAGKLSEGDERHARRSMAIERETGVKSGTRLR